MRGQQSQTLKAVLALAESLLKKKIMPARRWCCITVTVMDPQDDKGIVFGGVHVDTIETAGFGEGLSRCLSAGSMVPPDDQVDALGRMLLGARSLVQFIESVAVTRGCAVAVFERAEVLRTRGDKQ